MWLDASSTVDQQKSLVDLARRLTYHDSGSLCDTENAERLEVQLVRPHKDLNQFALHLKIVGSRDSLTTESAVFAKVKSAFTQRLPFAVGVDVLRAAEPVQPEATQAEEPNTLGAAAAAATVIAGAALLL